MERQVTVQSASLGMWTVYAELVNQKEPWSRWDKETTNSVIGVLWRMTDGRWTADTPGIRVDPNPIPPFPFARAGIRRGGTTRQDIDEFGAKNMKRARAKWMVSLLCEIDYEMKPVLATDAKATHILIDILRIQGIGRLKHTDVAYLWMQGEGRSNEKSRIMKTWQTSAPNHTASINCGTLLHAGMSRWLKKMFQGSCRTWRCVGTLVRCTTGRIHMLVTGDSAVRLQSVSDDAKKSSQGTSRSGHGSSSSTRTSSR